MMPTLGLHDAFSRTIDFLGEVARRQHSGPAAPPRLEIDPMPTLHPALIRKNQSATTKVWRDVLRELPFDFSKIQDRWARPNAEDPQEDALEVAFAWWSDRRGRPAADADAEAAGELDGFLGLLILTLFGLRESERRRSALADGTDFWSNARTVPHRCQQTCGELVEDAQVQLAIKRVYGRRADDRGATTGAEAREAAAVWERIAFDSARFYRHGTTSIILSARQDQGDRGPMALKLLLAPFQNVDSIVEATSRYASDYGLRKSSAGGSVSSVHHIVRAIASTSSWVLMEFIEGDTLAEFLQAHRAAENPGEDARRIAERDVDAALPGGRESPGGVATAAPLGNATRAVDLEQLSRLGSALFAALIEFERVADANFTNRYHGDLSPSNIIVSKSSAEYRFVLIDMGPNYLYTRSIGGAAGADSLFVAPEVKGGGRELGRSDVYSVGQLLILFAGLQPNADGVVPDAFYATAPLIAQFLEDLLDRNPDNRLLATARPGRPVYAELQTAFANELAVALAAGEGTSRSASTIGPLIGEVLRPFRGEPGQQRKIFKLVNSQRSSRDPTQTRTLRDLSMWSWISAVISSVTILVVLWWLYRDANWDWGNPVVESINRLVQGKAVGPVDDEFPFIDSLRVGDYNVPDLEHNWLARAVGLSYALLGAKLYQSIFARVSPLNAARDVPSLRWYAIAAELNMRSVSIVNSLLVLSITLFEAKFWPIAAAFGQTYAFTLNYSSEAFSRKALKVAREAGISTVPDNDSKVTGLAAYSQWVPSSFFYAIAVWIIGTLLYTGGLKDAWLYAAAVTSINIGLFYIIKCGLGGPDIRVGLQRAAFAANRVSLLRRPPVVPARRARQLQPVN